MKGKIAMLAEMIVTGAKVLTMDPAHPRAEAVALAILREGVI